MGNHKPAGVTNFKVHGNDGDGISSDWESIPSFASLVVKNIKRESKLEVIDEIKGKLYFLTD